MRNPLAKEKYHAMNVTGLKVVMMAGLILLLPVTFEGGCSAGSSSPPPSVSVSQSVKGKVMIITDEFYVVQDAVGKGMVQVLVNKATKLDRSIKKGDWVQAILAADGYAVSIKKIE